MRAERFEILNEKEERLTGLITTEHPRKRQPALLILNGFLDTMESSWVKRLARLSKEGYVTVRFDYTYGFGSGSGTPAAFTLSNQVGDATRVLDYLTRRGYVTPERIAVAGHCFGGMAAILLAAFEKRVKAVIAISTPFRFLETRVTRLGDREMARSRLKRYFHLLHEGREVRIDYTFFEDGLKKDMTRAVRNLTQPLLLIHGSADESVPLADAEEIYERAPGKKELHLLEGMAHHPTDLDLKRILPLVNAFLGKHV